jgi:hypothetical protein
MALFALAVQMAASFKHVHVSSGGVDSAFAGSTLVIPVQSGVTSPASPANPSHTNTLRDFCAICVGLSLAGSLIAPAASVLASLQDFDHFQFPPPSEAGLASRPHSSPQARAPPLA